MNDEEFTAWFTRDYRLLVATVTAVSGSRRTAEDAVSEAFARAYARRRHVATMRAPSAWVYRVAVNEARMSWRRARLEHRWRLRQIPVFAEPPDHNPQLWAAVASLPLRQREVVALRYLASYTQEEIAKALRIAPGTVASTLHDARTSLGRVLNPTESPDAQTG